MNAWIKHLQEVRKKNKKLPLKEIMKLAKKTYKKK